MGLLWHWRRPNVDRSELTKQVCLAFARRFKGGVMVKRELAELALIGVVVQSLDALVDGSHGCNVDLRAMARDSLCRFHFPLCSTKRVCLCQASRSLQLLDSLFIGKTLRHSFHTSSDCGARHCLKENHQATPRQRGSATQGYCSWFAN
jgi:hypothetical protein